MATYLYRLGRAAYRRWPIVMLTWLVVVLGVGGFAATQSRPMTTSFTIPGIKSLQAADTQKELFPQAKAADKQVSGQVVLKAPDGHTLADQPYKGQVDQLVKDLSGMPQLQKTQATGQGMPIANPVVAGPALTQQLEGMAAKQGLPPAVAKANAEALSPLSKDSRIGTISWTFAVDNQQDVEKSTQDYVHRAVDKAKAGGLTVVAGGNGMQAKIDVGGKSELIGIGIALVVLVLTFGSLVAAGLPIMGAIVGVVLGGLGITAATHWLDLSENTPSLSSMIGLAVGIDYSLFILSRYRAELRHTTDRSHAAGRAIGTAGGAVVFAGLTVIIALVALTFSGISMLASMGIAAAATVAIAVLVALTLLPAILGMLKGKAFAGRVRKEQDVDEEDHTIVNGSVRLGQGIRKAPALVALATVVLLGLFAIPVKDLHLGLPSDATASKGTDARTSADILAEGFGPGKNAPMIAVVDSRGTSDPRQRAAAAMSVAQWAGKDGDVANAQVVQVNKDYTGAVVMITPKTGPADRATDDLLTRLRDDQGSIESQTHAKLGITGQTAIAADVSSTLAHALPTYLAVVVGLAFLLLMLVFRSVWVPLMATLGFLLSILATLGVTVRLVQDGWFGIFDPQPVMSVMPTLLIGIVFGLAMDYQVFLTSRIREAYVHGMDARDAVIDGFRHSGRVVTAAAIIMISVFAAFAFQDNALIKSIGVALAMAVLLDAFLVRMVLVPALLILLGRRAWWLPRWLDKAIPKVDVEGENLSHEPPAPTHGRHRPDAVTAAAGSDRGRHHRA